MRLSAESRIISGTRTLKCARMNHAVAATTAIMQSTTRTGCIGKARGTDDKPA